MILRALLIVFITPLVAAAADATTAGLDRGISFFEDRLKRDPEDFIAANQLADRLLRRQRWTGSLADLRRAQEVAALSLKVVPGELNRDGIAASAQVALAMHRFAEARSLVGQLDQLNPGNPTAAQLLASALTELGDLTSAERALDELIQRSGAGVSSHAGLARLAWSRGELDQAGSHLDAALASAREAEPPAPEVLVWALVQRGEHAFRRGDHAAAEKLYAEAQTLAPENWSVLEHLAELRGAQGRDMEAAQLFEQAAKATDRPELWQALGDLHAFYKRPAEAKTAHDRALAGYRDSLARGEVLYVHHLAGFFSDSQEDAAQAVAFARRDLELRQSGAAWDALAWALYRQGDFPAAEEASAKALATGLADPHVLYHAATIRLSAGAVKEGQALLRRCAEVNPHFAAFHIHR